MKIASTCIFRRSLSICLSPVCCVWRRGYMLLCYTPSRRSSLLFQRIAKTRYTEHTHINQSSLIQRTHHTTRDACVAPRVYVLPRRGNDTKLVLFSPRAARSNRPNQFAAPQLSFRAPTLQSIPTQQPRSSVVRSSSLCVCGFRVRAIPCVVQVAISRDSQEPSLFRRRR